MGSLSRMTPQTQRAILRRADGAKTYDLSVEYFMGMPSGVDPAYQISMCDRPHAASLDGMTAEATRQATATVSSDAIVMNTHTGTHVDALNHVGIDGTIYGGHRPETHLGASGWTQGGSEQIPPIVARGLLVDVASALNVDCLEPSYEISQGECEAALEDHGLAVQEGDVVLVRTGRMTIWPQPGVLANPPGLGVAAARWLTSQGVLAVGADQDCVETWPSRDPDNWLPGHCHLLAEAGVLLFEMLYLEELARDGIHEFCFVAAPLRLRGATGAPVRPLAIGLAP